MDVIFLTCALVFLNLWWLKTLSNSIGDWEVISRCNTMGSVQTIDNRIMKELPSRNAVYINQVSIYLPSGKQLFTQQSHRRHTCTELVNFTPDDQNAHRFFRGWNISIVSKQYVNGIGKGCSLTWWDFYYDRITIKGTNGQFCEIFDHLLTSYARGDLLRSRRAQVRSLDREVSNRDRS